MMCGRSAGPVTQTCVPADIDSLLGGGKGYTWKTLETPETQRCFVWGARRVTPHRFGTRKQARTARIMWMRRLTTVPNRTPTTTHATHGLQPRLMDSGCCSKERVFVRARQLHKISWAQCALGRYLHLVANPIRVSSRKEYRLVNVQWLQNTRSKPCRCSTPIS